MTSKIAPVILILLTFFYLGLFLVLPLAAIFVEAFRKGFAVYLNSFNDEYAWSAIRLTLLTAGIAVPLNVIFGVVAAWCITKFEFWGKNILITLIDLPFAVSPVIAGLVFVLIFGRQTFFGEWLLAHNIKIIFATPGLVLATIFVTFPFVVRELIPLMQEQGVLEEEAAVMLGAGGWDIFWRVTFPNIKWGLLYGVILCNARAMGEFGAVSVVSGHIRGETNTIPLYIQTVYDGYAAGASAFAMATLLAALALITLIIKSIIEWKEKRRER
ncbi:MAG: sulfate ABC transporter permease subunit CysW [Planctomycetaceae bacterium]|jgi:sulfate transport system permease protein|nr:sulfate ABC transporter permease subunit CysW [Planctomycetaceae bacterium]